MIVYTPLWETAKNRGLTANSMRVKHGLSGAKIQRLRKNTPVSTNTLNDLCRLLDCEVSDIILYVKEEEQFDNS